MQEGRVALCVIFAEWSDIQESSEQSVDFLRRSEVVLFRQKKTQSCVELPGVKKRARSVDIEVLIAGLQIRYKAGLDVYQRSEMVLAERLEVGHQTDKTDLLQAIDARSGVGN